MIELEFCEAESAKSIKEMDFIGVLLALNQSTNPKEINQGDGYHWYCLGFKSTNPQFLKSIKEMDIIGPFFGFKSIDQS